MRFAVAGIALFALLMQSQSQLKAIYKDNADTIVGNCDTTLFLGGKEKTTLKEMSEGYCDGAIGEEIHPCKNTFKLGIYCFKCTQFSFCECPNEIAISGEKGLIEYDEDCIGFGGNMEPDTLRDRGKCISLWKSICRRKIKEAYDEYISVFKAH